MMSDPLLESMARDELTPKEAAAVINNCFDRVEAVDIYSAFARWTWIALSSRRFDDELKRWHRLMKNVVAALKEKENGPLYAQRLNALCDLINLSIDMSTVVSSQDRLSFDFSKPVLDLLAEDPEEYLTKLQIADAIGLKLSSTSRLLNMLIVRGAIERDSFENESMYRITAMGMAQIYAV